MSWRRSLSWSPTIALSWLWGLGFFYALHVTYRYGWAGFLAFAVPNAVGLGLFGVVLGRLGPQALEKRFLGVAPRFGAMLLLYQVMAVAISLFAFAAYFLRPIVGDYALAGALLLAVAAACWGHVIAPRQFRLLHAAFLVLGVAAALAALAALPPEAGPARDTAWDGRFVVLGPPMLVGFLLGPWLDLQQWQRACLIRADRASLGVAYAGGGLLFLGLLCLNALLVAGLPAGIGVQLGLDGLADAAPVLADRLASLGPAGIWPASLFGLWAVLAIASTVDSAYAATRWFLIATSRASENPLLGLLPPALVQTPLWMLLAALGVAGVALQHHASLLLVMAPFGTLFIGFAACLALEVLHPSAARADTTLCFLLGVLSALVFAVGHFVPVLPLVAVASLLPLAACAPLLGAKGAWASTQATGTSPAAASPAGVPPGRAAAGSPALAGASLAAGPDEVPAPAAPLPTLDPSPGLSAGSSTGHFDGQWFLYDVIPTYDDTNSVGNVYFANYFRWVGKTRELFFAKCVPSFDLKTTRFFILTRDFYHQFVRETREFEKVLVRIRISKNNRKFVTLEHEIRGADGSLLGKGHQQLMFVDSASYRLIDVPVDMLRGFLPYAPKTPVAPAGS